MKKQRSSLDSLRRYKKSMAYHAEAAQYIAGGVNSNVRLSGQPVPLCFQSARGCTLTDIDGNEYFDYAGGMGPTILGHAPGPLVDAVAAKLADGQLYAGQSLLELELAKRLQAVVPCAELVRFGMSGSEMVQASIRLARAHTGRPQVVKFEGHYHGWFDNVLVNLSMRATKISPDGSVPLHTETRGQLPVPAHAMAILPWNDLNVLAAYLDKHAEKVACILMEPVMCNSGVIGPRAGYLEGVRELCDRHGIVFIMDEVITGFRLGLTGAQGRFGVAPDIATFAKAFGGGFPIAAMAGRKNLMQQFANGSVNHSGTYNANVVSLSAGIATLDLLTAGDGDVYRRIESSGQQLMTGIREIAARHGIALRVQGFASVFYTYFSEEDVLSCYRDLTRCDAEMLKRFLGALLAEGVRPTSRGTWLLSASHDQGVIERTLEAVEEAVRRL